MKVKVWRTIFAGFAAAAIITVLRARLEVHRQNERQTVHIDGGMLFSYSSDDSMDGAIAYPLELLAKALPQHPHHRWFTIYWRPGGKLSYWATYDRQNRIYKVLGKWPHKFTNMTDACLLDWARDPYRRDPLAAGACSEAAEFNYDTGKAMTNFERENRTHRLH